MISFEISGELEMFRNTARDFARTEIRPRNREAEKARRVPEALARRFVELGLGTAEIPEELGGLGQGLLARGIVEGELAYGDIGIALGMPSAGPFFVAVQALGTDEQAKAFVRPLVEAGAKGAIAWTEPKPRPGTFATRAEQTSDGSWHLTGSKCEIVCGDDAASLVVFAKARFLSGVERPAAFVVHAADAGSSGRLRFGSRRRSLGLDAAPAVDLVLEDVIVPDLQRLSREDASFDTSVVEMFLRIGIVGAARSVGLATAAFDYARDYAEERTAFGKPIAHFQGLAFLMADMATRVEAMRTMVERALVAFDVAEDDAPKLAAMAIAECHEGTMFVTNNAVQVLGGAGYVEDHPVEKWMRDARAHMSYAMPHALCDLIVGRLSVDGGPVLMEHDAPHAEIQPIFV